MLPKLDMNPGHLIHRFAYLKTDIPIAGVAHQAGTCRFGTDPATSVLDRDCKAHELDNLVVDTSIFPSIQRREPGALTAMANSLGSETTCSSGWVALRLRRLLRRRAPRTDERLLDERTIGARPHLAHPGSGRRQPEPGGGQCRASVNRPGVRFRADGAQS